MATRSIFQDKIKRNMNRKQNKERKYLDNPMPLIDGGIGSISAVPSVV